MKFAVVLALLLSPLSHSAPKPSGVDGALESSARPSADRQDDAGRHPKELLEFSRVKAGDTVLELMPGKGYFTRLLSLVTGSKGRVIADVPKELAGAKYKPVESARDAVKGLQNVKLEVWPLSQLPLQNLDLVWTSLNYHDLHTKSFAGSDVVAFDRAIFKALKPGGFFIVVDHASTKGAPLTEADRLHRIDPAVVKHEVEAAGFVLDEESKVLATTDDHALPVFDPLIRGKTDQFVLRFRKP